MTRGDIDAVKIILDLMGVALDCENDAGVAILFHAESYLMDRERYELHPFPKGVIGWAYLPEYPPRCETESVLTR